MSKVKDIKGGTLSQVSAQTIDNNTMYAVTDYPQGGITNAQMTAALTSAQLGWYKANDVYLCLDSGTYTQNKFYKYTVTDNVASWTECSAGGGMAVLPGPTYPTTATVGQIGQFYLNTTTPKLFQCTSASSTYTWTAVGGGLSVLTGTSDPDTSTIGELGQIYINTTQNTIHQCCSSGSTYKWSHIGGTGNGGSHGYSAGEKSYTNYNGDYGLAIGYAALCNSPGSTAIGAQAQARGNNSIAIGDNYTAGCFVTGDSSIQIGFGTNSTARTLQIRTDNIYNHNTHTATFTNIQQGVTNTTGQVGAPVYGVLTGTGAPTTSTVGSVGQIYIDTTSGAEVPYICLVADTATPSYTWKEIVVSQSLQNNQTKNLIYLQNLRFKSDLPISMNKYSRKRFSLVLDAKN